ncbi:MAG: aminotransferase class I/II-fold pyridoxal phosphate-dependent enzyme [Bacteroidota bacterium]|nr:aminotransferase class I/II-fold pyridoxal phosphate-dependent enzyme [Bacteroidota bacterium]
MRINDFRLECYFAKYEFSAKYLLSSSDCESLKLGDLLQMADQECMALWDDLKLGYTDSKGHPLLRNEISKLYRKIKPEDIIVLAPEEGIFVAMNSILDRGDHVISIEPAYQSLAEIPESLGCAVTRWPVSLNDNKWSIDTSYLQNAIRSNTKLIIINFPHNPTGFIPDPGEFKTIAGLAVNNDIFLFSDEMYRYLEFSESRRYESAADIFSNGISLSGLSKSFGLPGLRTGWLATRNKTVMEKIRRFRYYTTICGSAPGEILSIIALRNKDRIISRNLDLVRKNVQIAKMLFNKHNGLLNWIEPQGGSIAFPHLNEKIHADEFCRKLIDLKSVLLLPASIFNFPGNHFRIGLGRINFPQALNVFESFIDEHYAP